jgi:galactosylceramidase
MTAGTINNFAASQWHNVKLQFSGATITGFVDGTQVLSTTNSAFSHGMAGLVTGDFKTRNTACFDNLMINAVGAATPPPAVFSRHWTPIYKP